jgi:LysM repeat protein
MPARSPARFLAPLALLAALAAVYLVVQHSDTGGSSPSAAPVTRTTSTAKQKTSTTTSRPKATKGPRTYTVRLGDTLTTIASRTGVSADQISELNPNLDPQALVVGTKIKLRP